MTYLNKKDELLNIFLSSIEKYSKSEMIIEIIEYNIK